MKMRLESFFQRFGPGKETYASRLGLTRLLRNEEGSIIVYMTLALPVLIGIAGLGVEGGFWLYKQRVLQSAADNAAISAAAAYAASTSSDITAQARAVTANDYNLVNGQNNVTVAVNRPPTGACYTGTSNYTGANAIEVIVTQPQTPRLAGYWLKNNVSICGRGVALVPSVGDCILALKGTGAAVTTIGKINNLSINLTNCSLFSDSTSSNSIQLNGNNNSINFLAGPTGTGAVGTAGGIDVTGNSKSQISNATTGDPPVADPYASEAASWPPTQTPAPTAPLKTCPSCTAGVATPSTGCTSGKNGVTKITLGAGSYTAAALTALHLSKCSTAINLTGGNYSFAASNSTTPVDLSGGPLKVQSAANIIVTGGGLTTGTVNFSAGNYSIYIAAGSWTTSGTTTFGSGNYTIGMSGSWTLGTVAFGNGNYNITAGGGWTLGSTTTFGSGNYTFALTGDLTSGALTMGTGTYSGSMANWNVGGNTTIGSGIYYLSGSFLMSGNNETVTGTDVTLVLTGAASTISATGQHETWTVTAPTASGWNQGIAVWEPHSTSPAINQFATGNNSTASVTGVIYAPNATIDYQGNSGSTPVCTQIVASVVQFGGNSINITGNCPGVPGLKTFGQIAALVE